MDGEVRVEAVGGLGVKTGKNAEDIMMQHRRHDGQVRACLSLRLRAAQSALFPRLRSLLA